MLAGHGEVRTGAMDIIDYREAEIAKITESEVRVTALRKHLDEIIQGKSFKGSHRSGQFLKYIVDQTLAGNFEMLKERVIGSEIFGRSPSYDTGEDAIVRVTASDVRKRLLQHYDRNGITSEYHISLPLGSYIPEITCEYPNGVDSVDATVAHQHPATTAPDSGTAWQISTQQSLAADEPAVVSDNLEDVARRRPRFYAHPGWLLICLFLAITCAALIWQIHTMRTRPRSWAGQPVVAAFWSEFLVPHRETTIVLADSSVSLIEDIRHQPITLDDYRSHRFLEQIQASDMDADRKADLQEIFNHNLISFGEARLIQIVLGEIPPDYSCDLARARDFSADEMIRDNVILLGGKKAQPWDHLFDNDVNFVIDYDDAHSWSFVRNRNPKPGEQTAYPGPGDGGTLLGYATVAFLPNPNRTGHVIILAGTDSDATTAAAAFLTSEDQMESFRKALHVDRFPPFEVLLKVSRMSGTFFDSERIAYRTYPEPR
jgi:hypothetical protein